MPIFRRPFPAFRTMDGGGSQFVMDQRRTLKSWGLLRVRCRDLLVTLVLSWMVSQAGWAEGEEWNTLAPRLYSGQPQDWLESDLPPGAEGVRYFRLDSAVAPPVSFSNLPEQLNLSYLSLNTDGQGITAMGNAVRGDSGGEQYVQAVETVLVTWAKAADWPEWAQLNPAGYQHRVMAGIYEVQRDVGGQLSGFEYVGGDDCWVHIPWRPLTTPDGQPYPYNGYAVPINIPFSEAVALPREYVILISYDTERSGPSPLGRSGPYNAMNYGFSQAPVRVGLDLDAASLVQVQGENWNYSPSWSAYGSLMTEVTTRSTEALPEALPGPPVPVGDYLAVTYLEGEPAERAYFEIRPAPAQIMVQNTEGFRSGTGRGPEIVTSPPGLPVEVLYDGQSAIPGEPGEYGLVVTISDPNYAAPPHQSRFRFIERTFENWRSRFLPEGTAGGDPDGDGIPNLLEYVLDTDPGEINQEPVLRLKGDGAFEVVLATEIEGTRITMEASSNLKQWRTVRSDPEISPEGERERWRWVSGDAEVMFMRLRIAPN